MIFRFAHLNADPAILIAVPIIELEANETELVVIKLTSVTTAASIIDEGSQDAMLAAKKRTVRYQLTTGQVRDGGKPKVVTGTIDASKNALPP